MIEKSFDEVHSKEWLQRHQIYGGHELCILGQIVPWPSIIAKLINYYDPQSGRFGINLRILVALLILQKLRKIGDQAVINLVQENRYAQYFCNVADENLHFFCIAVPW